MGKQEGYQFRIDNTKDGNKFLDNLKHHLNKDSYSIKVRYTGKRQPANSHHTRKEDATSYRVYILSKREQDHPNPFEFIQRGREIEKAQQAMKNARIDEALTYGVEDKQVFSHEQACDFRMLREQNLLLEAKLSLILAGLKDSTKYRHFIDTVNSITHINQTNGKQYRLAIEPLSLDELTTR